MLDLRLVLTVPPSQLRQHPLLWSVGRRCRRKAFTCRIPVERHWRSSASPSFVCKDGGGDARHDCGPAASKDAVDKPRPCVWARREVFCIRALCASSMIVSEETCGSRSHCATPPLGCTGPVGVQPAGNNFSKVGQVICTPHRRSATPKAHSSSLKSTWCLSFVVVFSS